MPDQFVVGSCSKGGTIAEEVYGLHKIGLSLTVLTDEKDLFRIYIDICIDQIPELKQ